MTFIHPLLLGGLLLAGIPVLIHLIMQQKPKHLLFPAMRFLIQRHRTNQRRLRLRHLLLLALRILLIALFCLALARPRLFSERIGVGSERPVAAVLLFDTSYSMEYRAGERSRLDEARRRALELLDELPDGSRAAVLDSAEAGGEWLHTIAQARERITALKLRPGSGPVTRQISQAYRLFDELNQGLEPGAEPLPHFLYVFSDRTMAAWDGNDVKNLKQSERTNAAFVDVGVSEPQDLALGEPELPTAIVAPGDTVEIRVPVRATGMPCDTAISCQLDDETEAERKQVVLRAGQSEVIVFRRPVDKLTPGPHQARIKLESSDALPFNNECFTTFEVRAGRAILILADAVREAAIWQTALELKGFRCVVKPIDEASNLAPAALLRDYPAVCLLSVAQPNAGLNREIWNKLREYVEKGGGLAILPGSDANREAYGEAASQVMPAELVSLVQKDEKERGVAWNEGESRHPLMMPFREWRKSDNVDFFLDARRPQAKKYWEVRPYPAEAEIVVKYTDGRPALVERKLGAGRVLLFTVPLDRRDQQTHNYWSDSSFGLVLADKTVSYLAGDAEKARFTYPSGQPVTIPFPPSPYFPTYTLIGPGLTGAETSIRRPEGQNHVQVPQAVMFGQYTVFDSKGAVVARFSINIRPEESQLERVAVEPIEELLGPGSVLSVDRGSSLRDALQGRWLQPLELFPWLMIAILLALAIENLLSNRFYRQPAPEAQEQPAA
jgi:hypothetical protein